MKGIREHKYQFRDVRFFFVTVVMMVVVMIPAVSICAKESQVSYYGRAALQKLERGELLVQAYDNAVAAADSFSGGSEFSASFNLPDNQELEFNESIAVMKAVENDHPEYIWWSSNTFSPGKNGFTVVFNGNNTYYTAATLKKRNTKFEFAADTFLKKAGLNDSMTELDKAFTLYQVLIGNVAYNIEYMDQSAYAAFVDRQAVCAGYAKAYTYLLQKSGIQASYVPGEATAGQESGGHAWVLVRIDGQYYYCDPTLDDGGSTPKYNFFMKTDAEMKGNHTIDDVGYAFPATAEAALKKPSSTYLISADAANGGYIYPDNLYVRSGSTVAITMVPNDGYFPETLVVGNDTVNPVANGDGSYEYTIRSVDSNLSISGTFKQDTMTSTQLVTESDSFTVVKGNPVTITAALTTSAGTAVEGQTVSFSAPGVFSKSAVTDSDGIASVEIDTTAITEDTYTISIRYEGNSSYRESSAEAALNVLEKKEIVKVTAGNTVFYATYGGELESGTDYYYDDIQNRLLIYTGVPVTIGLKDGAESADSRIELEYEGKMTLTMDNFVLDLSTNSSLGSSNVSGITAGNTDLSLNLVGNSKIVVPDNTGSISKVCGIDSKSLTVSAPDTEGALNISAGNAGEYSHGITTGDMTVNSGTLTVKSGDVSEWSFSRTYGINATGTFTMNGGSVTANSGTCGNSNHSNATYGIYTGSIVMNKGTLCGNGGVAENGISMGIYMNSGDLIVKGGTIKGIGGKSKSANESNVAGSYGMFINGDLNISNGEIYAEGVEGSLSCGLAVGSSLNVSGGEINGISGKADAESLACLAQEDYVQSAGEVTLVSGAATNGDSRGLRQVNSSGKFNMTGGTLKISGTEGESLSSKGLYMQGGFAFFDGGSIVVRPGRARNHSVGIYSENTMTFDGSTIDAEGNDVSLTEGEFAFSSGIFAGSNISIKSGKIRVAGKKAPNSYGLYTYDKINISGGKIDASGSTRGLDGYSSGITGGSYAAGDISQGTVCGYKVASGYQVTKGSDASYPYVVSKSSGTSGENTNAAKTDGNVKSDSNAGTGGDTENTGSENNKNSVPSVGTKEEDSSGKAIYKVSGTSENSSGKTVVQVAYTGLTTSGKKLKSVTIPATVTLADGTKAQVTSIAANAFKNQKKLTKITIGNNIVSIGKNAFKGCKKLKKIIIKSKKLKAKSINAKAFKGISSKIVIKVPKAKKSAYKKLFRKKGLSKKVKIK